VPPGPPASASPHASPDHEHLLAIYEHMIDGILIVDADGVIVCANPAAVRMLAGRTEMLEGEVFGFPVADRSAVLIDLVTDARGVRTAEMRVSAIAWRGEGAHLLSLRDVTDQTALLRQLERAADFDLVTGLPNRRQFHQRLEQAIQESRRHGGSVGVIFIDLDDFKSVNDRHGHDAGDTFLEMVGQRLTGLLREEDTVARLSGDEFAIVLTQLEDPRHADVVALKVVASFEEPFLIGGHAIASGASVGIALSPQDADTGHALVRRADLAMYEAKRLGKGMYRTYAEAADREAG
jgi:diguanylate cyclase (GGDEF)-like protein